MIGTGPNWPKLAKGSVVFGFGLFSIGAQALLFRQFVWSLEGHDIAVGLFLACWLIWVAIGAWLSRYILRPTARDGWIWAWAPVAYVPAFALEFALMLFARHLAGSQSYILLPLDRLLTWSFLVCAPVSLVTGLLFAPMCRWLSGLTRWPITAAYILESAGSLVGGAATTLLLARGWSTPAVWLLLSAVLLAFSGWASAFHKPRWPGWLAGLLAIILLVGTVFGLDDYLQRFIQITNWSRILPSDVFDGSFGTAQGQYLYGTYHGQFMVIRDGAVVETLPETDAQRLLAAIAVAQRPGGRRYLVVGGGIGLCRGLLQIGSIEHVGLVGQDPQYLARLIDRMPNDLRIADQRFLAIQQDVRTYLRRIEGLYDVAIVDPAGTINSATNRLYTKEFLELLKTRIGPGGLVAVVIPGGENVIGPELAYLGASVIGTLRQVFAKVTLIPGEQTVLLASDGSLAEDPRRIRDGLLMAKDSVGLYPADALASLIQPGRVQQAMATYEQVLRYTGPLVNRDGHPVSYLYSLLLAARYTGMPAMGLAQKAGHIGVALPLVPVAMVVLLWWVYLLQHRVKTAATCGTVSAFVGAFAVFSTGLVGISTVIILLSLHQSIFGTLYIHMGLVSGLFMAGLCIGALAMQALVTRLGLRGPFLGLVIVHLLLLIWITHQVVSPELNLSLLALTFLAVGVCSGAYMPWAAWLADQHELEVGTTAARLQLLDHTGSAIGGITTSLLLIPSLGLATTMLGMAGLLAANIPIELGRGLPIRRLKESGLVDLRLRQLGYILFGIAGCCLVWSILAKRPSPVRADQVTDLLQLASQWTAGSDVVKEASLAADGAKIYYLKVYERGRLKGYVFPTDSFVQVRGYGGPLSMVLFVDPNGALVDHRFVRCSETPRYLNRIIAWLDRIKGTRLWGPEALKDVHAVTGATISSNAVLQLLRSSGGGFARQVLRQDDYFAKAAAPAWDKQGLYLIVGMVGAVIAATIGRYGPRLILLAFACLVGGFWLNTQYSSEQVLALLWARFPAIGLNGAMLLLAIPILVGIFGNIYCGYLCPFGGFQELVSLILPEKIRPVVSHTVMQKARFIKYLILFVFVVIFCLTGQKAVYSRDILLRFFDWRSWGQGLRDPAYLIWIVGVLALGIILFRRFWCRYLCPAGAFLSLFNHLAITGRWLLPAKRFGCCEFGLTGLDHLDCIWCDRCIHQQSGQGLKSNKTWSVVLMIMVLIVAAWLIGGILERSIATPAHSQPTSTIVPVSSPVQGRQVDIEKVKAMISQGQLSDKEAMYYRPLGSEQ